MKREDAYNLMCEMVQSPNLRRHGLAVEAIMKSLCSHLRVRESRDPSAPPQDDKLFCCNCVRTIHQNRLETRLFNQ